MPLHLKYYERLAEAMRYEITDILSDRREINQVYQSPERCGRCGLLRNMTDYNATERAMVYQIRSEFLGSLDPGDLPDEISTCPHTYFNCISERDSIFRDNWKAYFYQRIHNDWWCEICLETWQN